MKDSLTKFSHWKVNYILYTYVERLFAGAELNMNFFPVNCRQWSVTRLRLGDKVVNIFFSGSQDFGLHINDVSEDMIEQLELLIDFYGQFLNVSV